MHKKIIPSRSVAILLFIIAFLGVNACTTAAPTPTSAPTLAPTTAPAAAAKVLTIGEISNNPTTTLTNFQPLADYLAAQLGKHGYTSAVVKAAPDFDTMVQWLKSGEIDMTFDSPYPAMIMVDRAGVKPILRRWKGGTEQYHTVIFARADSNIKTTAALKGKMVAFEESFSTSGYMLPKAFLAEASFKMVEKPAPDAAVAAEEIGYVFTNGDDATDNVIQWVVSGKTAAGAVNNKDYNDIPEETRKLLVIVGETEPLPRHLVLVRGDIDPAVIESLKAAMLAMNTPATESILKQFDKTAKFDDFPQGLEKALTRMRQLYNLAEARVNQ
jgi:phosphonate transport system substrate-binding protein